MEISKLWSYNSLNKLLNQHKRIQGTDTRKTHSDCQATNRALPNTKPNSHLAFPKKKRWLGSIFLSQTEIVGFTLPFTSTRKPTPSILSPLFFKSRTKPLEPTPAERRRKKNRCQTLSFSFRNSLNTAFLFFFACVPLLLFLIPNGQINKTNPKLLSSLLITEKPTLLKSCLHGIL